ncbi:MAG: SGNH/GDSL hydrolase family protein [Clostridia bacterium]|nr:SGNH/GDSL hydrolase family protein [Clostridia bacterium]
MKKRILCFGDSNTYGTRPNGGRFDEQTRWPARMGQLLGDGYAVVEEGFGGRTTVFDDPVEGGYKSGADYLPPCLMSHNPLSLVILMLGANDAKARFHMSARTIAEGCMRLIRLVRLYGMDEVGQPPKILLAAPPPIGEWVMDTPYAQVFGPEAAAVTRGFAAEYARYARLMRCAFFDAGSVCACSREDAIHLTAEGHKALAEALAEEVRHLNL